jgi:phage baseplate assembly protein W
MAIILGSKPVKDTTQFSSYAYGITLPIQIGNTAFNQAFTSYEQVKSNIKNLLLTKKLERIMNPGFGSGLQELLFEQNDEVLISDIEEAINDAVEKWLPYVSIEDVNVRATNQQKDRNEIYVSITFRMRNSPTLESVSFTV